MSASSEPLRLAADFPAADEAEWLALVAAVLHRGGHADVADPVEALSTTTYDGIRIRPLYTSSAADPGRPGEPPYSRGATPDGATVAGWDVRVRHGDPDVSRLHRAMLADLATGATSLWLTLGDAALPVSDLGAALDGVHLDIAPVALDAGAQTEAAATAFLGLVESQAAPADRIDGTLGADPIGLRARTGGEADLSLLGRLATLAAPCPGLAVATVDGTVYHEAGASDADEVAVATAVGVAYLRALTAAGRSVDDALAAIEFRFAVTADQFLSIAKLRAARQVWGRVAELSGASPGERGQRQHAVTSAAMMTRRDPWVNMLRTTLACFAAAVAGADAITVLPFDTAVGRSDDFACRIARNTHAILHDESSLARVIDPAGGSWYAESLTAEIAQRAWASFTAIERAGGALACLDSGMIGELAARTRERRADDIAHRRSPITGVSSYALPDEVPVSRPAAPPSGTGALLPSARYAEPFDVLRDRAEAAVPRPAVFLAVLGPPAAHSARVAFATNLFNAGGLRVLVGTPADFAGCGTTVACLCSSDRVYAEEAATAAAALRRAGAAQVWLAGRTVSAEVDGYLFAGCDALDVLRTTLDRLGVPA